MASSSAEPMATSSGDPALVPASHVRQRAGPEWVRQLKQRMPRHGGKEMKDWFLAKEIPSGERWYAAEQTMLKEGAAAQMLTMLEAFDKVRLDLGTSRAAWYPQRYTIMVEGRPVQVPPCI